MLAALSIIFATAIALVLGGFAVFFVRSYLGYRGKRVVTCPETHAPVGAEIDAALAARTSLINDARFVITGCSRWPERAGCDQACLPQIEQSPEGTLVRRIVEEWFGERSCVYCGRAIRDVGGYAHPALRSQDGELREWGAIAPEELPAVLDASVPVCANCEVAEGFRRRFPNLVTERPETPLRNRAIH